MNEIEKLIKIKRAVESCETLDQLEVTINWAKKVVPNCDDLFDEIYELKSKLLLFGEYDNLIKNKTELN